MTTQFNDREILMKRRILMAATLATWGMTAGLLAGEALPSAYGQPVVKTKVLHFPRDNSLGQIIVESDPDPARPDPIRVDLFKLDPFTFNATSEYVGMAQGDVVVSTGRPVRLVTTLRLRQEDRSRVPEGRADLVRMLNGAGTDDLSGLSGLAPDDLCWLSVFSLASMLHVEERVLRPISHLAGLQILHLDSTGVTDKGMEYLRGLHGLKALELSNEPQISGAGLAVLQDLPALEYLQCPEGLTDAGLKYVSQLPKLRWLQLRTDSIRGPGLEELAALPRLERLCLVHGGDQHIQYLRGLTRLKGLTLWAPSQPLTDASLASIGRLTGLEELHVIGWGARADFTGTGMAYLKGMKNLKKVDLHSAIDDAGIRHLTTLADLESILHVEATAEGMTMLASFRNLKALDVRLRSLRKDPASPMAASGSANLPSLDDLFTSGVSQLAKLQSLEELTLNGGPLSSDDDLKGLESLSRLRRLHIWGGGLEGCNLSDKGVEPICKLRQLEALDLDKTRLTNRGLNQLGCLTNLKSLDVWTPKLEADAVALDLSRLTNLRRLVLGSSLQDWDLVCLSGLHHLEWLSLNGEISERTLIFLKDLSNLKFLEISGISCSTGDGLTYLGGLKRLESLRLSGQIPDSAVARLTCLSPSVGGLTIRTAEPIQDQTIARVKQALPRLLDLSVQKPDPPMPSRDEPLPRSQQ